MLSYFVIATLICFSAYTWWCAEQAAEMAKLSGNYFQKKVKYERVKAVGRWKKWFIQPRFSWAHMFGFFTGHCIYVIISEVVKNWPS